MTTIHFNLDDHEHSEQYNHVEIQPNGWVRCYDEKTETSVGEREWEYEYVYDNLRHYPPHQVREIEGEVDYMVGEP